MHYNSSCASACVLSDEQDSLVSALGEFTVLVGNRESVDEISYCICKWVYLHFPHSFYDLVEVTCITRM